jgi:hypothetical protein
MATDNLQVLPSPNQEFGLQVLKHTDAHGKPVYTIGVWEEGTLRCICHAGPIGMAIMALIRELEGSSLIRANALDYPRWSEIAGLVSRLEKSSDADCTAAAAHLEDLHSRLHKATAELDLRQERLAQLCAMLEDAAARSRMLRDCTTVALPQDAWFRLLAVYRVRQEGQELYTELHALREIAGITAETLRTVDDWLGHASTREAAMDSLWRLRRILERVGFKMPLEHLEWRGQIVRALEEAGLGIGSDSAIRIRQPNDKYWQPATGPRVKEVIQNAQSLRR